MMQPESSAKSIFPCLTKSTFLAIAMIIFSTTAFAEGNKNQTDNSAPESPPSTQADTKEAATKQTEAKSTSSAEESSTSSQAGSSDASQANTNNVSAPAKAEKPSLPANFGAAEKLFKEKKYAASTKMLEQFLKDGYQDEKIHDYLAQSYYNQHQYSKAIKEYQWAAKNARTYTTKNAAANTARVLACYMAGVCPGPCLNPNSSHWQPEPSIGPGLHWKERRVDGNLHYFSHVHAGDKLMRNSAGNPYVDDKIKCPICRGTGKTKVLKDGQPL